MVCALLAAPLGLGAVYWAFQEQLLFWRLFSAVGAFWMLSSALILFIAALLEKKQEAMASVVPVPPEAMPSFFELGRPICILQEAPNFTAVLVTLSVEILFALASLVLGFAAMLALRDGVLSPKLFMLVLLAPLLSGLLVFHGIRLVFCPLRVWLFPEGLVRVRGKDLLIQRWDRIRAVSVEVVQHYTSKFYFLTIEDRNGRRLEFGKGVVDLSSRDLERLANVVKSHGYLSLLGRDCWRETSEVASDGSLTDESVVRSR
jgi:hypothetical protein